MTISVQEDSYVAKTGKTIFFFVNTSTLTANNNYIPGVITSVNSDATVFVNEHQVQLGNHVFDGVGNWVEYLLQCGSVQSIAFSNAGTSSYTAPTISTTTPGVVIGTPVLATGILGYTITSSGSGYTTSFPITIPAIGGQSPSIVATAWVNVVSNAVVSVTPFTGSSSSYGVGYTGTNVSAINISLPGSGGLGVTSDGAQSVWGSVPVSGTGLTVTALIGQYIQSAPVISGGVALTAPPAFTITDTGSGAGAVAIPVMTGCLNTDIITYSASSAWITCTVNSTTGITTPGATLAPVTNWVGQIEGPTGHVQGFPPVSTLAGGINIGYFPISQYRSDYFTGKNKLKAADPWQPGFNCTPTQMTLDSNHYMYSWTPNSWVFSTFYSYNNAQNTNVVIPPLGNWPVQYDDDYYGGGLNGATTPSYLVMNNTNSYGVSITLVAGPGVAPVPGTVTVSGGAITAVALGSNIGSGLQAVIVAIIGNGTNAAVVGTVANGVMTGYTVLCGGSGFSGTVTATATPVSMSLGVVTLLYNVQYTPNLGHNAVLGISMVCGSDGLCHAHNPWVFCPNNTIDRSKPYATDDVVVANLTNPVNGKGPGIIRFMGALGGPFTPQVTNVSDILSPTDYSWLNYSTWGYPPGLPPNQPTFSGTTSAGSPTITGITNTSNLLMGQTVYGNGIPGILINEVNNVHTYSQSTISSVDSSTQITISSNAKFNGVQSLSINPYPSGTVVFTLARYYTTDPTNPRVSWSSPNVYSSQNFATSGTDSFGPYLSLIGGPLGNADNGNFITYGNQSLNQGIVELVSPIPHGLESGQAIVNEGQIFFKPDQSFTGTVTSGSNQITNCTNLTVLQVGSIVHGNGIPDNIFGSPPVYVYITVVSGTTITISANANANATGETLTATTGITWNTQGIFPFASNVLDNGFTNGPLWVTGPNTIAVWVYGFSATGGSNDYVASTSQVPIYLPLVMQASFMCLPVEYCGSMVAIWPNTAMHLNIPWGTSDAAVQSFAQRLAPILGPNNLVRIEQGNELWNVPGNNMESTFEQQLAYGLKYYMSGTQLYPHFNSTGGVTHYTTSGTGNSMPYYSMHCLMLANKVYVFKNAFQAAGGNPNNVSAIYGSQYSNTGYTSDIVSAVTTLNLPQDYICIAPYYGGAPGSLPYNASLPAGYTGPGSGGLGNYPIDAMNEVTRHSIFYSTLFQSAFSNHYNLMSGTNLRLIGYEGGMQVLVNAEVFFDQINQDAYSHSSMADVVYCWYSAMQNGNPNVANSGLVDVSYFSAYDNFSYAALWKLSDGANQPVGIGLANQFVTPQGGSPGTGSPFGYYQTNQATALQGLINWIGGGSQPSSPYFTGPTSGTVGQSLVFTISLPSTYRGSVTPVDSSGQGTFVPSVLYWVNSSQTQTFIYIPNSPGTRTISLNSNPFLSILDVTITLTVIQAQAESIILTGPPIVEYLGASNVNIGVPSANFTVTPNGLYTGIVTPTDINKILFQFNNGTFNPSSLTFSNSSVPQTFTYTSSTMGYKPISISTNPFITTSAPIPIYVNPAS